MEATQDSHTLLLHARHTLQHSRILQQMQFHGYGISATELFQRNKIRSTPMLLADTTASHLQLQLPMVARTQQCRATLYTLNLSVQTFTVYQTEQHSR